MCPPDDVVPPKMLTHVLLPMTNYEADIVGIAYVINLKRFEISSLASHPHNNKARFLKIGNYFTIS